MLYDPSAKFDVVFDEVTTETLAEEVVKIVRTVYCLFDGTKRTTDQIIADCTRDWSSRVDESSGKIAVAGVPDPIFIQESKFDGIRRLDSCLNLIGVRTGSEIAERFCGRSAQKHQVVSRSHHNGKRVYLLPFS